MEVLIIGGTGFISGLLAMKLAQQGYRVSVLTRGLSGSPSLSKEGITVMHGDRRDAVSLRKAVEDRVFDAVYDMVAYEPGESAAAAEIFRGKTGRFIHCSTISVYMVSYEVQCPITEDQDKGKLMDYFPRNPFGMEYGILKRGCEEVLWKAHDERQFPVSILRPTFVCGPRDPAKRDFFWIERILDGKPLLVPGCGDAVFQSVYVEDVADAFVSLLDEPASIGQAYNVAGEEVFSLNDYLHTVASLLGKSPELVHVDQDVFDAASLSTSSAGDVFPFNSRRTAVFSLDKIKRDLGFRPTPFKEWMPGTIRWFSKNHTGHSNGYERREDEVRFARLWSGQEESIRGMK